MAKTSSKEKTKEKQDIVVIDKEIKPIMSTLSTFEDKEITTPKEMVEASTALSVLNRILDRLTAEKKELTDPANEILKNVRCRYKLAETKLNFLIDNLYDKIGDYQTKMDKAEKEKEERIVNDGRNLKMETMERKFGEIERVDKQVATEAGMIKFRTDLIVTIVDADKIPQEFIKEVIYDSEAIKANYKQGIMVPGTKVDEKKIPLNYR